MIEISDAQAYAMNDALLVGLNEMLGYIPTDEEIELKGEIELMIPGAGFVSLLYTWEDKEFMQCTFNEDFKDAISIRKFYEKRTENNDNNEENLGETLDG